ncbi:VOC family protein [Crocinitomix catalasitica]|uniref:VOC family protein n=1 Tax=Crocinitomix catalasitica TaxID=184607 RepID=UPI0009FDC5BF|nr:VOC family protein [Crocinitomix catalasitica]
MKFAYTILYVEDVEKTLSFYENAFGFKRKMLTPEKDYAELNTGETTISFASIELGKSNFSKGFQKSVITEKPFGVELAFTTEQIEIDFEKALNAGAIEFESIKQKPWGQKVGYVQDINGFLIEICTPISM